MLQAHNLQLSRGERVLVRDLGLSVAPGGILHVLGPNGCGKTTLLRALAGLTRPDAGSIEWRNTPIESDGGAPYRDQMLFLGHQPALKSGLTPLENLAHYQALRSAAERSPLKALEVFGVAGVRDEPCGCLSAGQQRRVMLARLLSEAAALWILDEPLTALDDRAGATLAAVMEEHARGDGMTILTSHHALPLPGSRPSTLDLGDG